MNENTPFEKPYLMFGQDSITIAICYVCRYSGSHKKNKSAVVSILALESLEVAVVTMGIKAAPGQGTTDSRPITETGHPVG